MRCLYVSTTLTCPKPNERQSGGGALRTAGTSRPPAPSSDALVEEAVGMLCPAEKDEVILQMHAKLRHLVGDTKA